MRDRQAQHRLHRALRSPLLDEAGVATEGGDAQGFVSVGISDKRINGRPGLEGGQLQRTRIGACTVECVKSDRCLVEGRSSCHQLVGDVVLAMKC